jgi:hypothetical protein
MDALLCLYDGGSVGQVVDSRRQIWGKKVLCLRDTAGYDMGL